MLKTPQQFVELLAELNEKSDTTEMQFAAFHYNEDANVLSIKVANMRTEDGHMSVSSDLIDELVDLFDSEDYRLDAVFSGPLEEDEEGAIWLEMDVPVPALEEGFVDNADLQGYVGETFLQRVVDEMDEPELKDESELVAGEDYLEIHFEGNATVKTVCTNGHESVADIPVYQYLMYYHDSRHGDMPCDVCGTKDITELRVISLE